MPPPPPAISPSIYRSSLYMSLVVHQARVYPSFHSMKQLAGMLVHRRVTPSSKFPGTHLYTWVERGTMRVKCLAQEHNAAPRPGLEPGPPDPEYSALTVMTLCLPKALPNALTKLYKPRAYRWQFTVSP